MCVFRYLETQAYSVLVQINALFLCRLSLLRYSHRCPIAYCDRFMAFAVDIKPMPHCSEIEPTTSIETQEPISVNCNC